MYNDSMLFFDV